MKKIFLFFWIIIMVCTLRTSSYAEFGFDELWEYTEIHGFISQGFLKSEKNNFYADTKDGTLQFNEFGVNVLAEPTDRLHAGVQFFSRDLGDISNNELEIDWAYGDYRWRDWLGFRAGKLKISYGLYNETRDIDAVRTSIFLPQSIYTEVQRDTFHSLYGVSIYGNVGLQSFGNLSYQFQYGEKDITTDSGVAKAFHDLRSESDIDITSIEINDWFSGSLEWETPLDGLRLKVWRVQYDFELNFLISEELAQAISQSQKLSFKNSNDTLSIFSAEYTWNNLVLVAEYSTDDETKYLIGDEDVDDSGRSEGYYIGASYRFNEWFELGTYYSVYYSDVDDKDGKKLEAEGEPNYLAWQKDFTVTTRFDINEHWTFKLEGHIVNGAQGFFEQDNPDGLKENSYLLAVKTTFSF